MMESFEVVITWNIDGEYKETKHEFYRLDAVTTYLGNMKFLKGYISHKVIGKVEIKL